MATAITASNPNLRCFQAEQANVGSHIQDRVAFTQRYAERQVRAAVRAQRLAPQQLQLLSA
jgi:hypothetical protein